ncbi:GNAT family N-acetyltransferase, partial [Stenotrophomonas sp. HMWF022]
LQEVVSLTRDSGHTRLFLACSADPHSRSYGFYRHLGWKATGEIDEAGDEILALS